MWELFPLLPKVRLHVLFRVLLMHELSEDFNIGKLSAHNLAVLVIYMYQHTVAGVSVHF